MVLADWLQVDANELRYGLTIQGSKQEKPWYAGIPANEYEVLRTYLDLPADKKKIVSDVILAFKSLT
ncbi:hypothetical protein GP5015_979 [gamma proteobacterium HTCC5015]|nr:hypothetical protein GP5015_979 [gamma proteobacterium HTCC5015]